MSLSLELTEEEIPFQGESLCPQYVKRKRKEKEKTLGVIFIACIGRRDKL